MLVVLLELVVSITASPEKNARISWFLGALNVVTASIEDRGVVLNAKAPRCGEALVVVTLSVDPRVAGYALPPHSALRAPRCGGALARTDAHSGSASSMRMAVC